MDIIASKVLVAVLFGLIRFLCGVLPIKTYFVLKHKAGNRGMSALSDTKRDKLEFTMLLVQSFGTGVLFATCFLHMMPEVHQTLQAIQGGPAKYPYSQVLISVGFFITYCVEEVIQWMINQETKKSYEETLKSQVICAIKNVSNRKVALLEFQRLSNSMGFPTDEKEELRNLNKPNEDGFICRKITERNEKDAVLDQEVQTENNELARKIENVLEEEIKTELQILRCFIMVVALTFDTILEGLVIGLQTSPASVWYLFAIASVHSVSILLCISLEIHLMGMKEKSTLIQLWLLSGTTTFGVLLGVVISSTAQTHDILKSWPICILKGLSTGTILYVTFFEALNREKAIKSFRAARFVGVALGFSLIALLECLKSEV